MGRLFIGSPVVDYVAKRTNEFGNFGCAQGIGWLRDGELVAGVVYAEFNGPNVVCHIASDGSRHWLTREYLWTIFDYPFNQMGVNRITVCVGQGNADSTRFVKHLGFTIEAELEGAHPTGSLLIFRMFRNECSHIRGAYAARRISTFSTAQAKAA